MTSASDSETPPHGAGIELLGPGDLWYKEAIVYSLNIETFQDSNGDGIGDFPGLTSRIGYLHSLGVTCIWLQPFYPSPRRDNGYDVIDYYGVNPALGTLGDFVDFLRVARERGIRVMIDLVVNHTSDQHPWFQAARRDPASPYRDYYIWTEAPPTNAGEGMMFPGIETSTWTQDDVAGLFYFHRFYRHQPDLNLGNPAVREEIRKIMGFWLELGVSGFRVDAAPFLIERKGIQPPEIEARRPHTFFRYMRNLLSWRRGDAALLAEANVPMSEVPDYVGSGDKLHMLFGFHLNQHLFLALATERATPLIEAIGELAVLPDTAQWANFLRNHDELDLSRLTAAEQEAVYEVFAPDPAMRLYGRGIRRRLSSMLGGDRSRMELAHALMLALPGTPVLYYGDEIGMGEDLSLGEREAVRTPMQWSAGPAAGFSQAPHDRLVRPLAPMAAACNVVAEQRDPSSFLNWLQRAIGVRTSIQELAWGRLEVIPVDDPGVLVLRCSWRGAVLVSVTNVSRRDATVSLSSGLLGEPGQSFEEVLSDHDYEPWRGEGPVAVRASGYRWIRCSASRGR